MNPLFNDCATALMRASDLLNSASQTPDRESKALSMFQVAVQKLDLHETEKLSDAFEAAGAEKLARLQKEGEDRVQRSWKKRVRLLDIAKLALSALFICAAVMAYRSQIALGESLCACALLAFGSACHGIRQSWSLPQRLKVQSDQLRAAHQRMISEVKNQILLRKEALLRDEQLQLTQQLEATRTENEALIGALAFLNELFTSPTFASDIAEILEQATRAGFARSSDSDSALRENFNDSHCVIEELPLGA